jgi:UDP-N-acetylglucosamine 4-epimerase
MSRFLVTGGAGFIGSNIAWRLLKAGHSVRVLDNFSSGKEENLSFAKQLGGSGVYELIRGDIRDKSTCDRSCEGIDYVLHQAALRSVPKSMRDPESYNEVNIGGTLNMLQAASKNKVKRFVFASSSSVYGDTARFPEREDFTPQPISPYALTKLAGEHYCAFFQRHYGLPAVSLRYFNVFGPRQALDDEYAVVIPKFISCLLRGEAPPVFGTGRQSRDFTYIDNVVEANILAAANLKVEAGVFNIASGKDYSVLELVRTLNSLLGKTIEPAFLPLRPGDVFRTLADLGRSKKLLGYNPRIDFLKGLDLTIRYFKENA